MKPVIGITSNFKKNGRLNCTLNQDYVCAVNNAGGIAIILPIVTDEHLLDDYIQTVDGLIFSGGEDISPLLYAENAIKEIGTVCLDRDKCEMGLFNRAFARKLPVLGICRGMQLINVALGGTLYQDIKTQIDNSLEHRSKEEDVNKPYHNVQVTEDGKLYKMIEQKEFGVNSFHHQSLKDIGKGLKVTAFSPDRVIEGIESTNTDFLIGLQWHPEKLINDYPMFENIFRDFIMACINKN